MCDMLLLRMRSLLYRRSCAEAGPAEAGAQYHMIVSVVLRLHNSSCMYEFLLSTTFQVKATTQAVLHDIRPSNSHNTKPGQDKTRAKPPTHMPNTGCCSAWGSMLLHRCVRAPKQLAEHTYHRVGTRRMHMRLGTDKTGC